MKYVVSATTIFLVVAVPGCCLQPSPQTRPSEPAVQDVPRTAQDRLESTPVGRTIRTIPSVEFRKTDSGAFGFVGLIGDYRLTIPTIVRNHEFRLQVDEKVWTEFDVDAVTLSNFRAYIGPPWVEDPYWKKDDEVSSWSGTTVTFSEDERGPVTMTLATNCPDRWPHRLIVFDVEVRIGELTFKFVDPWDEKPGGP